VTAGSAPTLSVWVNTPTNQLGEYTYDANGNQLTGLSSQYFTYDSENRMIGAYTNGSDYVQYAYDSQNKRVFSSQTGNTVAKPSANSAPAQVTTDAESIAWRKMSPRGRASQ